MDRATNLLNAAINIIFIGHQNRTALGVIMGAAIYTLTKVFSPLLAWLSFAIDLSKLQVWEYLILGAAILHIKTIDFYLFKKGSLLGENEEKALEVINRAKAQGVPEKQIQKMYIDLCEEVLRNTHLKETTKRDIENFLNPQRTQK